MLNRKFHKKWQFHLFITHTAVSVRYSGYECIGIHSRDTIQILNHTRGVRNSSTKRFNRNGERMFHTVKDLRSHVSRSISREERNIQKPSRTVGYLRSEQRVGERRVTRARFFPMLQEFRRAEGLNANRTERNECARWS